MSSFDADLVKKKQVTEVGSIDAPAMSNQASKQRDAEQLGAASAPLAQVQQQQQQQVPLQHVPAGVGPSFPGAQFYDPTTAAMFLNPNTAATAFAALAASAAQQVAHAQQAQVQAQVQQAVLAQVQAAASQQQHMVTLMAAPSPAKPKRESISSLPSIQASVDTSESGPKASAQSQQQQQVIPAPAPTQPALGSLPTTTAALFPARFSELVGTQQQQPQEEQQKTAPAQKVPLAPPPAPAVVVPAQQVAAVASAAGLPPHVAALLSNFPGALAPQQQQQQAPKAAPVVLSAAPVVLPASAATVPEPITPAPATSSQPQVAQHGPATVALAAQMMAAHASSTAAPAHSPAPHYSSAALAKMQTWKLNQLESHVQLLRDSNQQIPQSVAMLVVDARKKEERRNAKRVANRKSACNSRARKKALVEQMTKANARLRRQAMILALLPDLVIAITPQGEITFCSQQVERVLKHKIDDLVGANLSDLLVPECREALGHLVKELVAAEMAVSGAVLAQANANGGTDSKGENGNGSGQDSGSGISSGNPPIVSSEQSSFPLSVVQVKGRGSGGEMNSDLSTSNNDCAKAPTGKPSAARKLCASASSSFGNDDQPAKTSSAGKKTGKEASSDDSFSSLSGDANNVRKANENLSRNVRWHNEQMKMSKAAKVAKARAHRDDVTGQTVTANNADARLSSLQYDVQTPQESDSKLEEQSSCSSDSLLAGVEEKKKVSRRKRGIENSSDESGYRESNESAREESSSDMNDNSSRDESGDGLKRKPLAPTCTVGLIRDDLSTIWCEVTSSIRTRSLKEENQAAAEAAMSSGARSKSKTAVSSETQSVSGDKEVTSATESTNDEIKELLLCLRPIRDGAEPVPEALRFRPPIKPTMLAESVNVGESSMARMLSTSTSTMDASFSGTSGESVTKGPPKKRPIAIATDAAEPSPKKIRKDAVARVSSSEELEKQPLKKKLKKNEIDPEKNIAECLVQMSNKASV